MHPRILRIRIRNPPETTNMAIQHLNTINVIDIIIEHYRYIT